MCRACSASAAFSRAVPLHSTTCSHTAAAVRHRCAHIGPGHARKLHAQPVHKAAQLVANDAGVAWTAVGTFLSDTGGLPSKHPPAAHPPSASQPAKAHARRRRSPGQLHRGTAHRVSGDDQVRIWHLGGDIGAFLSGCGYSVICRRDAVLAKILLKVRLHHLLPLESVGPAGVCQASSSACKRNW